MIQDYAEKMHIFMVSPIFNRGDNQGRLHEKYDIQKTNQYDITSIDDIQDKNLSINFNSISSAAPNMDFRNNLKENR